MRRVASYTHYYGWMDEDATWYGSRHRRRPHCMTGSQRSAKGAQHPLLLGPCLLWPRSSISATAELLIVTLAVIAIRFSIERRADPFTVCLSSRKHCACHFARGRIERRREVVMSASACLSACLSVREHISGATRAMFAKLFVHAICCYGRGWIGPPPAG